MEQTFMTAINIVNVRHLENITIPLSTKERKHLILTGKNGSGKTSVLEALLKHFDFVLGDFHTKERIEEFIDHFEKQLTAGDTESDKHNNLSTQKSINRWKKKLQHWDNGATTTCTSFSTLRDKYSNGKFVLAYYKANRSSKVEISNTIESIQLKDQYGLYDSPGTKLVKYMVGLKATQAFAQQKKDTIRAGEIEKWFERFEGIMKKIFGDPSLELEFDIDSFEFRIFQANREPFDFNTMSSGFSAVFDIINDLIMRMEKGNTTATEGIVLIDEIDTHLHLELQRTILPILTGLFPNIQFIVSTHSPFILNSIDNAVIFDLETEKLAMNGLANYPYDGIVESFFDTDTLSSDLRGKLEKYKALTEKVNLTDEDCSEIASLECDLDEIPDFLSPEIASEYSRLKLEFSNRG